MSTATTATRSDSLLRMAMRVDAVCSALCGIAFVVAAGPLSSYTGIPRSVQYGLGLGFVLYGITVFVLGGLAQVRTPGIGVAIANALGTVLAVVVVVAGLLPLTTAGVVVVLAIGVYTLVFADLQYIGVRQISR